MQLCLLGSVKHKAGCQQVALLKSESIKKIYTYICVGHQSRKSQDLLQIRRLSCAQSQVLQQQVRLETYLVTIPHLKCCKRSREKKYERAKHTQHLLGLCLDPVNAVSLSLEGKKNPLQMQLLPSKPLFSPL